MKLELAIGLCLSLGVGLASCGDDLPNSSGSPLSSPSPTPPVAAPEPALPPPDTAGSPPELEPIEPLPSVDAEGNYRRTSYRRWSVVDPDPAGLNCRWSPAVPEDWYSPAAQYPRMNVSEWPVVQQFPTHTELLANISPAGFAILYDENEQPWLKVSLDDQDRICLVRAHEDYVEPVQ